MRAVLALPAGRAVLGQPEFHPILLRSVSHPDDLLRLAVVRALHALCGTEAGVVAVVHAGNAELALALLRDPDSGVAQVAAKVWGSGWVQGSSFFFLCNRKKI